MNDLLIILTAALMTSSFLMKLKLLLISYYAFRAVTCKIILMNLYFQNESNIFIMKEETERWSFFFKWRTLSFHMLLLMRAVRVSWNELSSLKLNASDCSDYEESTESDIEALNLLFICADCKDWTELEEDALNLFFWRCDFLMKLWCCILSFCFSVSLRVIKAEIMLSDDETESDWLESDWLDSSEKDFSDILSLLINILLLLKWSILNEKCS